MKILKIILLFVIILNTSIDVVYTNQIFFFASNCYICLESSPTHKGYVIIPTNLTHKISIGRY